MTRAWTLRAATTGDAAPLARATFALPLFERYGVTEAGLARDLERAVEGGDGVVVAEDAAGPLGFAWWKDGAGLGLGGYLKLIAVRPGAASRGVGSALLAEVERAVGVRQRHLMLLVSDFNEGAQRFYERHGYARCGRLPALVRPDVDELLYWKRLG